MTGRAAGRTVVGALVAACALFAAAAPSASAATAPKCNGHVELCRRRYDEVAYAATHNSMNTVADGFRSPDQERRIADQLAAGVRAFLIDVYRATPGDGGAVCTDPTPLKVAQVRRESGQAVVDQLLAARAGEPCPAPGGPTSGLYLCHSLCELGATSFDDRLGEIRRFLRRNPDDVVTLILEDYAPAADIMASLAAAGLGRQLVRHEPGTPWPTLRQMARRGTRLVVFSQNQGGAAPGLLDAFAEMNETPYTFRSPDELSCAANRGPATAPLFLLNHWIESPDKRASADAVNQYTVLDGRARQCATERGHMPNFVAVNFSEDGDLLRVVDDLNRVG